MTKATRANASQQRANPGPNPDRRKELLAFLATGPKTIREVAGHLGINDANASVRLGKMRDRGVLSLYTIGGRYVYEVKS